MTIEASGTLVDSTNIHYLYTLVRGEALRPFGILSAKAGSINSEHLKSIILGLGKAFPPVNALSKQKRTMRRGIQNPRGLKLRRHTAFMINLKKYLSVFPGEKASDKMCKTKSNIILLNCTNNSWIRQAYMQGFDCKTIAFKNSVKMFE